MADFSNSNVDSRYNTHSDSEDEPYLRFIVVGKRCHQNKQLITAIQEFDAEVEISDTGFEFMNEALEDSETCTVFVLDNFEGDVYTRLHRAHCRIVGPPVVIKCALNNRRLPKNSRPMYCTAMHELVLCFTGFRIKEDLSRLADLVHHMGGSIRKDISKNVTHLVANSTKGEKYGLGISLGLSIMTEDWIHQCWEQKENISLRADDEQMLQYRVSPFYFCVISTYGFTEEEERDIENQVVQYGGSFVEFGAPSTTHLVVNSNEQDLEVDVHPGVHLVTDKWIWESVMLSACARESQYRWGRDQGKFKTPGTPGTPRTNSATPNTMSGSKSRKRKKLKENLAQLAFEGEVDTPMYKRRSSEMGHMSCGQSFLDVTPDVSAPGILHDKTLNRENSLTSTSPSGSANALKEPVKWTARHNTVMELFQTEKNFVGILHTLLKVFKEEIEKPDQRGGSILDPTDVKLIFGKIPPIYDLHLKIRDSLNELMNDWDENCCVGDIYVKNTENFRKTYPPFVNFFENIKESIKNCDKNKPRFHAFLKICQSKPECGRQSLTDLLIRLVQRLPSVILLLKEIDKKTDAGNPDKTHIKQAIECVESVMRDINNEKRTTELHQMLFELFNEIENVPADLLSASRFFLKKVDVVEISDVMHGRGENATIFLLSDQIEMCKRRVKVLNAKSPGNHVGSKTPQKAYKHAVQVPFNHVKRVLNIKDTPECKNVFGLITREGQEAEKLYAFTIVDENVKKDEFLQMICKQVAAFKFRVDHESLLATVDATTVDLQLDFTDLGASKVLGKAAARFGKRVSKAFSFKQTPRKLKRAISSMVMSSPLNRRDSTASISSISSMTMTPSGSGLTRGNRMASCNDLADESCYMQENSQFPEFDQLSMGTPSKYYHDTISREAEFAVSRLDEGSFIDHFSRSSQYVNSSVSLMRDRANTFNIAMGLPNRSKKNVYKSIGSKRWDGRKYEGKLGSGSAYGTVSSDVIQSGVSRLTRESNCEQGTGCVEIKRKDVDSSFESVTDFSDIDVSESETEDDSEWRNMGYYTWLIWKHQLNDNYKQRLLENQGASLSGTQLGDGPENLEVFKFNIVPEHKLGKTKEVVKHSSPEKKSVESIIKSSDSMAISHMSRGMSSSNRKIENSDREKKSARKRSMNDLHVSPDNNTTINKLKRRSSLFGEVFDSLKFKKKKVTFSCKENKEKGVVIKKRDSSEWYNSPRKKLEFNTIGRTFGGLQPEGKDGHEKLDSDVNFEVLDSSLSNITTRKSGDKVLEKVRITDTKNNRVLQCKKKHKDSPMKRMISHGSSKYKEFLKEKFSQYAQQGIILGENKETYLNKCATDNSRRKIKTSSCREDDIINDHDMHDISGRNIYCSPDGDHSMNNLENKELDEISIGSSIAPSFTSEINVASNTATDSWRRETLAGYTADSIKRSMESIDECDTENNTTYLQKLKQERFRKPRRLSSIFSNGNSPIASLQGTSLFPRKAATISTATSKKYF